jgi:hypothetical protein
MDNIENLEEKDLKDLIIDDYSIISKEVEENKKK